MPTRTRTTTSTPGVRKVVTRTDAKQPIVTYEARIRTDTGREVQKSFARLEDARAFRSEVLHQRSTGTLTDARLQKVTFTMFVNGNQWQKHLTTLRPKTLSMYLRATAFGVETFGTTPLHKITPETIKAFQGTLGLTLNPGGIRLVLRVIRACFGVAEEHGFVQKNPAKGFKVSEDVSPQSTSQRRALSEDESARLLAAIPDRYRALIATSLILGLRFSELAGLQRHHIDLRANQIRVEGQAYWHRGELHLTVPKTKAGTRVLPIPSDLAPLLTDHLERHALPGDDGLVFPSPSGSVVNDSNFRARVWLPALERAGLPHLVFHGLRITSVTNFLDLGVNPKVVASLEGHSSPTTTLNIYARSSESSQREAVERVGSILGRALKLPSNVVSITRKTAVRKTGERGTDGAEGNSEAVS